MRNLWINLLLAFCIYQLLSYVQVHTSKEYYLAQEVVRFNEDVENRNVLDDYHISVEIEPNKTAKFVGKISEYSRKIIGIAIEILLYITNGFN